MARKRLISPSFFTHGALYDAEQSSGLPLRLAFAGLWTACDRRGVFEWNPRVLKLSILPYDNIDFAGVLAALGSAGFIRSYVVDGKTFGHVPSFERWQTFHKNEKPSDAPAPPSGGVEPSKGGAESSNGRRSTPVVIAVAVTDSSTGAGAALSDASSPSSIADAPANQPTDVDEVSAFVREHDFGPFAQWVEGICRAARFGPAVLATLRMHLAGEMGHEKATPRELGLAAQQFVANGKEFSAKLFAGYVRDAKKGADRTERRQRNAREEQYISSEDRARAAEAAEAAEAEALIESFAQARPERYKQMVVAANADVPMTVRLGRESIIRGKILAAIRREPPQAGAA